MSHITTSNRCVILLLMWLTATLTGCGDRYEHVGVGLDSPQGRQLCAQVEQARQAGVGQLEKTYVALAAPNLPADRAAALRAALSQVIASQHVEITALDRFGEQVYRVSLKLADAQQEHTLTLLLVYTGQQLRWAGPN